MATGKGSAAKQLAHFFRRNGYVRPLDTKRREKEKDGYKKGYELRLVAESPAELRTIRGLLRSAGYDPGRAFAQGTQIRQPLYGREQVTRFRAMVEAQPVQAGDHRRGVTPVRRERGKK